MAACNEGRMEVAEAQMTLVIDLGTRPGIAVGETIEVQVGNVRTPMTVVAIRQEHPSTLRRRRRRNPRPWESLGECKVHVDLVSRQVFDMAQREGALNDLNDDEMEPLPLDD